MSSVTGFVKFSGGITGKQAVYIKALCTRLSIETPQLTMTKEKASELIKQLKEQQETL